MGRMKDLFIELQQRYQNDLTNDDADIDYLYEKYLEEKKIREEAQKEEEYLKNLKIQKDVSKNHSGDSVKP